MNKNKSNIDQLFNTVVNNGYCIGCGACAVVEGSGIEIEMNTIGCYEAVLKTNKEHITAANVNNVCPFADFTLDEDEIAHKLYFNDCDYNSDIGYYNCLYAGHVQAGNFREEGSSGGMVSWILCELLDNNFVDGILHIKPSTPSEDGSLLFKYGISRNSAEVQLSSKSRYYPIQMTEVLKKVMNEPGRYAIVGLPCFIKAVRLLISSNEIFKERIKYCIGLVCGHLKSKEYTNMLAWQCGIRPEQLHSINYRKKIADLNANEYAIEMKYQTEQSIETKTVLNKNLFGTDWGLGLFKYKACDFCDDLFGETADITIGDAWIKPFINDPRGNNIVIIRNHDFNYIVEKGLESGKLVLKKITPKQIVKSQKGGFFHRRVAISYRLYLKEKKNEWFPTKRIAPSPKNLSRRLKKKQILRTELAERSHIAFQKALDRDEFSFFLKELIPSIEQYRRYEKPVWVKIIKKVLKIINSYWPNKN